MEGNETTLNQHWTLTARLRKVTRWAVLYLRRGSCLPARTGWRPGRAYSTTWKAGKDIRQHRQQPREIQSNSSHCMFQPAAIFFLICNKLMLCFRFCCDAFSKHDCSTGNFHLFLQSFSQTIYSCHYAHRRSSSDHCICTIKDPKVESVLVSFLVFLEA